MKLSLLKSFSVSRLLPLCAGLLAIAAAVYLSSQQPLLSSADGAEFSPAFWSVFSLTFRS